MRAQFKTYNHDGMYEVGPNDWDYVNLRTELNDCEILSYVTVDREIMAVVKHGVLVISVELDRLVLPY